MISVKRSPSYKGMLKRLLPFRFQPNLRPRLLSEVAEACEPCGELTVMSLFSKNEGTQILLSS